MPKAIAIKPGTEFNWLTVKERIVIEKHDGYYWRCQCRCGKEVVTQFYAIKTGRTKSCGCYSHKYLIDKRKKDITGQHYSRWTVLKRSNYKNPKNRNTYWVCKCDCGTVRVVSQQSLTNHTSKSCGCLQRESARTHGMSDTKVYRAWCSMLSRCLHKRNNRFKDYGGANPPVKVYKKWRTSFQAFYSEVGNPPSSKHSIDRINTFGNYEPGNVRWATAKEQANNRRRHYK